MLRYNWINTDDGWDTKTRAPDGKLQPDLTKFPDGIAGLVKVAGVPLVLRSTFDCTVLNHLTALC